MLGVDRLCEYDQYKDFSKDMFDMILNEAEKTAADVIFSTMSEGDKEGCTLKDGKVSVPQCFHQALQNSGRAAGSV